MKDKNELQNQLFAQVFMLSNTLQVYLDQQLMEDQITSKQMFLMIVIGSFGETPPTFKEAAYRSGSSYQNIKQMALKLEKKGFLDISDDPNDKRAKRLVLSEQAIIYWQKRDQSDSESMKLLFENFDIEELSRFLDYIQRLQEGVVRLDNEGR